VKTILWEAREGSLKGKKLTEGEQIILSGRRSVLGTGMGTPRFLAWARRVVSQVQRATTAYRTVRSLPFSKPMPRHVGEVLVDRGRAIRGARQLVLGEV